MFCGDNWQKTPVIAGRNSSLLTANNVLLIASDNTEAGRFTVEAFSTTGIFGKSSPLSPLNLYLPSPALISIAYVCGSTENAIGCSGKVFNVSNNIFEGTAILPSSLASTAKDVIILVCKSVAEMIRFPSLISNKKFSNMGNTALLLSAPLTDCKCFSNVVVETMNLILSYYLHLNQNYKF